MNLGLAHQQFEITDGERVSPPGHVPTCKPYEGNDLEEDRRDDGETTERRRRDEHFSLSNFLLAKVVTRSPQFSRSVPLLKSLHWLAVHYRIILKICTIAYQALSSTQPTYLNSMLTPARNSRQLCSTNSNPLYIPRVKTKAGTRAFSVASPTVWDSLPASVKSKPIILSFLASSSIH